MAKKIKMSRKQIKSPDEFLTWSEKAWDWVEVHAWEVGGIIAGVVALFLLVQASTFWFKSRKDSPRIALTNAINTLYEPVISEEESLIPGVGRGFKSEEEKYQVSASYFESIITDHPGTIEAEMSIIYAARAYEHLQEYDKAIDYYNKYNDSAAMEATPELKESSVLGLARCYYAQDQFNKSLEYLNQIIESESAFKADAMLLAARCNFRMDDKEKADELINKLKVEFPDSWMSQPANFITKYWVERDEIINKSQNLDLKPSTETEE